MSIDERLAFLLQSTESLHASMQELHTVVSELGKAQQKTEEIMRVLAQAHLEHEDSIARLALIAESQDKRISDLEAGGE